MSIDVLHILRNAPDLDLPEPLEFTSIQENAYCLHTSRGDFFLKWFAHNDPIGQNELAVNQKILPGSPIAAPRLLFVQAAPGGKLAAWPWLKGSDLRSGQRGLLVQAFTQLGRFHAARRHIGAVYSPVTHHAYTSVPDLLSADLQVLCSGFSEAVWAACRQHFTRLEAGYPTVIHGDMHPGNIYQTADGLWFTDWGYALSSLNLFDLDYIECCEPVQPGTRSWWSITPQEAESILPAYFDACGMGGVDHHRLQRAVMVYNELRSHANARKHRDEAARIESAARVKALLGLAAA